MLRLRPSELTLTSDDVEETFRRMSLRQTTRPPTKPLPRPCGQPGRLTLRRGPERSTRDAISSLGNIPILQPQQAVFTSVDEDVEDVQDIPNNNETSAHRTSNTPEITSPVRQRPEESARTLNSSSPRTFNLPFRLGRERRHRVTQSCPDEQRVDTPHTPPPGPSRQAPSGSSETNGPIDNMPNLPPTRSATSANSTPGLRGGGSPRNGHTGLNNRDALNAPSPLNQVQRLSSPPQQEPSGDPTKSPSSSPPPTLYLRGYFTDPNTHSEGLSYDFDERVVPHTEPRRHAPRQTEITRSLSSGGTPSFLLPNQRPIPPTSSTGDVFGTVPAPEPPRGPHGSSGFPHHQCHPSNLSTYNICKKSFQADQPNPGSRQFSSDVSTSSARYSYYGSLNSSRVPSSEQSVSGLQLDGAASSFVPNAPPRSFSDYSHMPVSDQYGPSPRPSSPYTHSQNDGISLYPPPGFGYVPHGVPGAHMDAATAATQGLYSPLEGISQQYLPSNTSPYSQQIGHVQAPPSNNYGGSYPPYLASTPSGPPQHPLRPVQRSSEQLANSAPYGHPSYGRGGYAPRGRRRRGGNAPGMPAIQQRHSPFNGHVQTQRAAYESLSAGRNLSHPVRSAEAQPYRHSMPHRSSPFDMTNRPQDSLSDQFSAATLRANTAESSSGRFPVFYPPPTIPIRHDSRQYNTQALQRTQTHRHAQLRPPRDRPQTSLALDHGTGTTSRLPRSPVVPPARTYRRVPPEQRDQENDNDRSLMRREEANLNARYGEEEQLRSTMDDTPPGIGRVERRMLE